MEKRNNKGKINYAQEVEKKNQLQRQEEDRAFNAMLLWVCAAVVAEVVLMFINRMYNHATPGAMSMAVGLHKLLLAFPVIGIVLFVACLAWSKKIRAEGGRKTGTIQIVLGGMLLCIGILGFVLRIFGAASGTMVMVAVPGLAILAIIFYVYQKEFFASALVTGLGILGLWMNRADVGTTTLIGYLVVAAVVTAALIALGFTLNKNEGMMEIKGERVRIVSQDASYKSLILTAVIMVVLLAAAIAMGSAIGYYGIWVAIAWLFVLGVYFTAKMM